MDSDDCKPAFRQKQTTIRWGEGGAVSYGIVSILSINAALWSQGSEDSPPLNPTQILRFAYKHMAQSARLFFLL